MPNNPAKIFRNNPPKIFRNNPPKSSLENGGLYAYWIKKNPYLSLNQDNPRFRQIICTFSNLQICKLTNYHIN